MTQSRPTDRVRGALSSYRVVKDGWGVGEVATERGPIAVTGKLVGARPGDAVELRGEHEQHPRWGRQFRVVQCDVALPDGDEGAVRWMASRLPGVGEKRARKLIAAFGGAEKLWAALDGGGIADLVIVRGVNQEMSQKIHAAYHAHRAERDAMVRLRGWGLTDHQCQSCLDRWGALDAAAREVGKDPYCLAREVDGFGFMRADAVALKMGVRHDAPERLRAAVEHVLERASEDGHVYLSGGALQEIAARLLGTDKKLVGTAIREAAEYGRIVRRGWRVYSGKMDAAEARCAEAIVRMVKPC